MPSTSAVDLDWLLQAAGVLSALLVIGLLAASEARKLSSMHRGKVRPRSSDRSAPPLAPGLTLAGLAVLTLTVGIQVSGWL